MPEYTLECDDQQAQQVQRLAVRHGLTEREVLEQLVAVGLEELD
ncbi:CopG family transcriptional regulator [Natronomonas pharaonis]|nr:CopG family transcriptional regulator [Natronomonas pharaonis]